MSFNQCLWMLNELIKMLHWQNNRLLLIEKQIQDLSARLDSLTSTPSTKVDKIEYNFDQLKIETLNGHLSIGIPPGNMEIDDLELGKDAPGQRRDSLAMNAQPVQDALYSYIDEAVPSMVEQISLQNEFVLEPDQKQSILDDIKKQISERIKLYIQHEDSERVINRQKNEIMRSIEKYVQYFKEEKL